MRDLIPPFVVVPMPLNKYGQGPEMDQDKVVKTIYQVWDGCNRTLSNHETEGEAKIAQMRYQQGE